MSGADIKPRIINDYDGADIVLNEKLGVVMDTVTFPQLRNYVGQDLIVTDGEELSAMLDNAAITGKSTVDFIIGGSYGLSNKVKNRADFKLSMSKMTFPHQMARMVLSEQIYRAFEISTNGKYHK